MRKQTQASTTWMTGTLQLKPTVLLVAVQGHTVMTNQCKVAADDSKCTTLATSTCSLSPPTSGSNNVDLTICSKVQFQLRDGVPGVPYQNTENTAGWTPVIGRRRKEPQLPSYVLRRFPPDHPLRQNQSNSDSETDEEICIPQNADADVCFNILDGCLACKAQLRSPPSGLQ